MPSESEEMRDTRTISTDIRDVVMDAAYHADLSTGDVEVIDATMTDNSTLRLKLRGVPTDE